MYVDDGVDVFPDPSLHLLALLLAPVAAVAAEPVLPAVVCEVRPAWPADTGVDEPVVVVLDIAVDVYGSPSSVVAEPTELPDVFVTRALDVGRDLRFRPGRNAAGDDAPMTIRYGVRFDSGLQPSAMGVLRQAGTRQPVAGALLHWNGPNGQLRTATTDGAGGFALAELATGEWSVEVRDARFEPATDPLEIREGSVVDATLWAMPRSSWDEADADLVVDVVAQRPAAEIVERTLAGDDLRYLPGSGGDLLRAVQNLPGVGRAPFGIGQLLVRGTAPEDARYTVDGMELPLVFHFGGLTSVMPSDLVERVDFLTTSFGVRYGRNLGGRVDVVTDTELPDRVQGNVSLDLFQVAGFVAVPIDDRTAVFGSIRRSYADVVLTPVLSQANQRFRAPRYYDAQLRVLHEPASGGVVDALVVLSDDRFRTFDDRDPDAFSVGYATTFQKGRFRWVAPLANGWKNELSAIFGPDLQSLSFGDSRAIEQRTSVDIREELTLEVEEGWSWRMGMDVASGRFDFDIDVDSFGIPERGRTGFFMPAFYVEPTWKKGPWTVTPALRTDLATLDGTATLWSVDPRLTVHWDPTTETRVSLGVGRFSQMPTFRQLLPAADGTPNLRMPWSLTSSLGVRQALPENLEVALTLWLSRLDDLVVGREGRFRFFTTPPPVGPIDTLPYANAGDGWTYGAEVSLRWNHAVGAAWLTATLGRSLRRGRGDDRVSIATFDQPYVVNALGTVKLPKRWRFGLRARVTAGLPYTPVANRVQDLDSGGFLALFDDPNAARIAPFFSLDVRVDKTWVFRKWELSVYLDVLNSTNSRNLELIAWSEDYAVEDGILGLPILPIFGLRGDW